MTAKRPFSKSKSDNVLGQARWSSKMFRVGLYGRVSTNDQQTLAMQNRAMREYAGRRGWMIALQVREVNFGAARWEARERLLRSRPAPGNRSRAHMATGPQGPFGNGSVGDVAGNGAPGCRFRFADRGAGPTRPAGRAMARLLAIFAKFERGILRERTRAGLAHAGRKGKKLDRPSNAAVHAAEIRNSIAQMPANLRLSCHLSSPGI